LRHLVESRVAEVQGPKNEEEGSCAEQTPPPMT
jgi:hypothetical protein